jgi:hypothetical protein
MRWSPEVCVRLLCQSVAITAGARGSMFSAIRDPASKEQGFCQKDGPEREAAKDQGERGS